MTSVPPAPVIGERPLRILTSYSMDSAQVDQEYANELHSLAQLAGRTLHRVADDAQVVYVDATHPYLPAASLVASVDAVLILGGADVDPQLYTSDAEAISAAKGVDRAADDFEIALVHAARDAGKPLLGICRGMQIMNVALGGSLIPDLGGDRVHNDHPFSDNMTDHDVSVADDSMLAGILNATSIPIRSSHHQAVDRAADVFTVTARADDGVIEAVEAPADCWTLAVQWHPEDRYARADDFTALLLTFVHAARSNRTADANDAPAAGTRSE